MPVGSGHVTYIYIYIYCYRIKELCIKLVT